MPTAESRPLMNDAFAAMVEESEVLSLVEVPGLLDPLGLLDSISLLRVLLMAIPVTEVLVALLGNVAFVVVST